MSAEPTRTVVRVLVDLERDATGLHVDLARVELQAMRVQLEGAGMRVATTLQFYKRDFEYYPPEVPQ